MRIRDGESNDPSALGRAYTRGHGLPIGWRPEARCSKDPRRWRSLRRGSTIGMWLAAADDVYEFGGDIVAGAQLQEMALLECAVCPVQWECTATALLAGEPWGIWGVAFDDLQWLLNDRRRDRIVERARADGVPVQFAVSKARRRRVKSQQPAVPTATIGPCHQSSSNPSPATPARSRSPVTSSTRTLSKAPS